MSQLSHGGQAAFHKCINAAFLGRDWQSGLMPPHFPGANEKWEFSAAPRLPGFEPPRGQSPGI